jgi:hypothetical protein
MPAIPLWLAGESFSVHPGIALVVADARPAPPGFAVLRHADAAAVAQSGACSCCRVPSGLTAVLRQLFLDRVRGDAEFEAVIVAASHESAISEAMSDPLVAARYEYRGKTA